MLLLLLILLLLLLPRLGTAMLTDGAILTRRLLATSWQQSHAGSNETHFMKAVAALRWSDVEAL